MKELLAALEAQWAASDELPSSARLPVDSIELLPSLYQARGKALGGSQADVGIVSRQHVADLAQALIARQDDLDPILVLRVGERNILVDGHHRLRAYKSAKRKSIPVVWFPGSPKAALVAAGTENSKTRLPMLAYERTQRAWQLVASEVGLSKAEVCRASGVSDGTVAKMRRHLKAYKNKGESPPEDWMEVMRGRWEADPDRAVAEEVQKLVNALNSGVGPAMSFKTLGRVALLAQALVEWSPKRAEAIALMLVEDLDLHERVSAGLDLAELEHEEAGEDEF